MDTLLRIAVLSILNFRLLELTKPYSSSESAGYSWSMRLFSPQPTCQPAHRLGLSFLPSSPHFVHWLVDRQGCRFHPGSLHPVVQLAHRLRLSFLLGYPILHPYSELSAINNFRGVSVVQCLPVGINLRRYLLLSKIKQYILKELRCCE